MCAIVEAVAQDTALPSTPSLSYFCIYLTNLSVAQTDLKSPEVG